MAQLAKIDQEILSLQKEKVRLQKLTVAKCTHCNKGTTIAKLTFIQTKWYVPPRGCSEGDYWNNGEGQWQCPHCNKIVRLIPPNAQVEKLTALKYQFRDIKEVHES